MRRQVVLFWRSQKLGYACGLFKQTGAASGTLAGGAHQRAFLDIARGDAALLSEVFQRDFDLPLLSESFPDEPVAAYFEFAPKDAGEASRVLDDAVKLVAAGVRMDPVELAEKTGYRLAEVAKVVGQQEVNSKQ